MDLDRADIRRILSGDPRGYGAILERYRDYVFTICKRVLRDDQWAEEAAQDAFVKAFRSLEKFRGEARFSTWLYRIAWTTSVSRLRSERRHRTDDLDGKAAGLPAGGEHDAFGALAASERSRLIEAALDRLSPEEGVAVTLFYLEDRPLAEIAGIAGDSVNTVKVRLHRARKRLAERLKRMLREEWTEL